VGEREKKRNALGDQVLRAKERLDETIIPFEAHSPINFMQSAEKKNTHTHTQTDAHTERVVDCVQLFVCALKLVSVASRGFFKCAIRGHDVCVEAGASIKRMAREI
jgi:hypothetical protein